MKFFHLSFLLFGAVSQLIAQFSHSSQTFSKADSLRGTINADRSWWNVLRYDLEVEPDFNSETIRGANTIRFSGKGGRRMQIDLQHPMVVDSMVMQGKKLSFVRDHHIYLVNVSANEKQPLPAGEYSLTIYFQGKPRKAIRPPWDGGWIWTKDLKGRPWMTVACQGLGASVWYPCKDHQSDEPEQGASLTMVVPDSLVAVANGKLISTIPNKGKTRWRWEVKNPINNYNLIPYIGKYTHFEETISGADGLLQASYWVLDYDLQKAREQFDQVKGMIKCFEYWFGPYPFYEDGYKLVQAPHLGMEHQSAIAYGNQFMNGYQGSDLSGTGWGNKWDFIIIHESGHEWFGNNITTNDIADMWVHEGFTSYSETLFTECLSGKKAGDEYIRGVRRNIRNDRPVIGPFGVNKAGSGDMYSKAANMIHTIRTLMQNDSLFRSMLHALNRQFYHSCVDGKTVEEFITQFSGISCKPLFDQYLRTTQVPVLEWKYDDDRVMARFTQAIDEFRMPVFFGTEGEKGVWQTIAANQWSMVPCKVGPQELDRRWNRNLYIEYRRHK